MDELIKLKAEIFDVAVAIEQLVQRKQQLLQQLVKLQQTKDGE